MFHILSGLLSLQLLKVNSGDISINILKLIMIMSVISNLFQTRDILYIKTTHKIQFAFSLTSPNMSSAHNLQVYKTDHH